jgi:hypothetical protein
MYGQYYSIDSYGTHSQETVRHLQTVKLAGFQTSLAILNDTEPSSHRESSFQSSWIALLSTRRRSAVCLRVNKPQQMMVDGLFI